MMYQIPMESLDRLLAAIAAQQKLYLPTDNTAGEAVYTEWTQGAALSKKLNTLRSAKDFFFPQIQNMAKFRREGKKIEVIDDRAEADDFCIFGVRACDVRSFDVLDNVFLADPVDTWYETRRKHATVISLACGRPGETCFCHTFGIDAAKAGGDIQCWETKDTFYLETLTEKGQALADALIAADGELLTQCGADQEALVEKETERIHKILEKLPLYDLKAEDNRERELELFRSKKWKELSSHCLGCGACTFVCPTCQCFDIEDFNNGETVQRYRCWDSCMYHDFTLMAAGTPRLTQTERFRQRFMHKLVYYPKAHDGLFSCVGCGRCLRKCPIHMNIVKVMETLKEEKE